MPDSVLYYIWVTQLRRLCSHPEEWELAVVFLHSRKSAVCRVLFIKRALTTSDLLPSLVGEDNCASCEPIQIALVRITHIFSICSTFYIDCCLAFLLIVPTALTKFIVIREGSIRQTVHFDALFRCTIDVWAFISIDAVILPSNIILVNYLTYFSSVNQHHANSHTCTLLIVLLAALHACWARNFVASNATSLLKFSAFANSS